MPLPIRPISHRRLADLEGQIAAIRRSQAVIEFAIDGTVLWANEGFLDAMGYRLDEIVGQHHRLFVDAAEASGGTYAEFWARLRRGSFEAGQFRRIGKGGRDVWIQATYNPILDGSGQPFKVVKYATDITAAKRHDADMAGQVAAIQRAMAVIEFDLDGRVLSANEAFLAAMGYRADEVLGQPHSMFLPAGQRQSAEYRAFWAKLARGEFDRGQYLRIGKGGREVWIEASYNPVLDPQGRPWKVVKYASDITARKRRDLDLDAQMAALHRTQAVIEFDPEGRILEANELFVETMGARREDLIGQHHRLFMPDSESDTAEYRAFWETLRHGTPASGRFLRRRLDGTAVWLRASYNPVLAGDGSVYKIVKFASDVTEQIRLAEGMASIVAHVRELAQGIHEGAETIAEGNNDLAERTEEQAGRITESAQAMAQLLEDVKANATNAQRATALSANAAASARESGDSMAALVGTMEDIRAASRKIADIIGVIDGIAFQTNILALNAAVEAARAGEQGRGFAVVAGEVRALAQRSASAARDVRDLILRSNETVASGTERAGAAGVSISRLVESTQDVAQLMSEVSGASFRQSAAIEQVTRAIQSFDEMAQHTASMVQETATIAGALDDQSRALFEAVADRD